LRGVFAIWSATWPMRDREAEWGISLTAAGLRGPPRGYLPLLEEGFARPRSQGEW
jgi:hypothetical protein